ncbi:MAG: uracil-DNA glycosylase family protein [Thermoflexibacteraceae bacterium]
MIEAILTHFKIRFPFDKFYDNLLYNISTYPDYHITNKTFLKGYYSKNKTTHDSDKIKTNSGDVRVDLPVWFGNVNATCKLVVIGMEPRDTDKEGHLNIERVDNYVFATPFALERPKGPYHSAFRDLTNHEDVFSYFTDVVKTYGVSGDKVQDDLHARQNFAQLAQEEKPFLLKELEIIKPTKIVALGNESFTFLKNFLGDKYNIQKVRHPSQGGATLARQQLSDLLH